MDLGLKNKRVLITGGTRSIGRAIVDAFLAEGAVVGFCARDAKLVAEREKEWQGKQGRVSGAPRSTSPTIPPSRNGSTVMRRQGGIDHFIANVSALGTDNSPAGWRKSIDDRHRFHCRVGTSRHATS